MNKPKDGKWWKIETSSGDVRVCRYWLLDGDSDAVWNVFSDESMSVINADTCTLICKMEENAEPQKKFKYEKVTESIFDLKGEFERGELYSPWSAPDDIEYHPISDDESVFISVYMHEELYRRIEIDPIEELAKEFHQIDLNHKNSFTKWDDLDRAIIDAYLEMAKHAIGKCGVK